MGVHHDVFSPEKAEEIHELIRTIIAHRSDIGRKSVRSTGKMVGASGYRPVSGHYNFLFNKFLTYRKLLFFHVELTNSDVSDINRIHYIGSLLLNMP
jgi:hypothetical protein